MPQILLPRFELCAYQLCPVQTDLRGLKDDESGSPSNYVPGACSMMLRKDFKICSVVSRVSARGATFGQCTAHTANSTSQTYISQSLDASDTKSSFKSAEMRCGSSRDALESN